MPININIKKNLHVEAKSTRYNRGRVGINRNEGSIRNKTDRKTLTKYLQEQSRAWI